MKLVAESITKKYGAKTALDGFSYTFRPGIYGLLGPNGAGKSTLIGIITTGLKASTGRLLFNGEDTRSLGRRYRRCIGYMPQHQKLYEDFSLRRYLYYISALKGLTRAEADTGVDNAIHAVNLWEVRDDAIGTFSGGMKQRSLLAQAILGNPGIVVMDEPTVGLDPLERIHFRDLVSTIAGEKIIIIATHIVSDLEKLASEIIFLNKGVIPESGPLSELTEKYRDALADPSLEQIYMHLGLESH
jgi:ABC-type multidrug transport system ATPase subunit